MRVADIHAHIFPDKIAEKASGSIGSFYDKPSNHTASLQVLKEQEALAGVSHFVGCGSAVCASQVEHLNEFIAASAAATPNMVPFGSLFPTMEDWEPALEKMVALGIRGVKIHPDYQKVHIDDPGVIDMYRAIAAAGLPVLFHMGDFRYDYSAPERLTNLIRQVPDLVAIAAHFGGWQSWDRSRAHIQPENVFYDTSSSLMYIDKDRALDLMDTLGADRFVFGTDFPMWTPKEELERFLALGLDRSLEEKILFGNFERLFLK